MSASETRLPSATTSMPPTLVTILAARSLVAMPPTPTPESVTSASASISGVTASTTGSRRAVGSRCGLAVYRPSTSDRRTVRRGIDDVGDECPEGVVVAEPDLVDRDGVVLVDDRQHLAVVQRGQHVAQVEVAAAVVKVLMGEQQLRANVAAPRQDLVVRLHEQALANRGAGLKVGDVHRPTAEAQRRQPGPDRP